MYTFTFTLGLQNISNTQTESEFRLVLWMFDWWLIMQHSSSRGAAYLQQKYQMDNALWWILQCKSHHHYYQSQIFCCFFTPKLPLKFFLVPPPCLEVLGKVLQFGLMCRIWANVRTKYLVKCERVQRAREMLLKHCQIWNISMGWSVLKGC